ncbi:enoyl-CoA hydratase/isomerase family protein [Desulfallas sp. Bu1-1]|uniref:enoyl-CoA hydratase/isomerase family protein n=1 Tax=Desulfallas sp. Bu1-1 TaxID=2787620 RepID=UPI00189F21ED|nr:enoyl-CoA hydratase/isomerase family protein [Desulfallas sp. Bu1-1]MBF7083006.1 enoyl-CoA hydratase/isomerase family protein [Desulfallas sp. Bu1-1]
MGLITLENPKKKNVISSKLISEMLEALNEIEADNNLRVTVITGSGDSFCAGYDISELAGAKSGREFYPRARNIHKLFLEMEDKEKPIIAAINGITMGGGLEMSMACDIRIAAESAVFAVPEIHVGLLPAAGGMTRLPRLVGVGMAKELIFTGRRVTAEEALRIGLLNKVVPDNQLMDEVMQMAKLIASRPPISIAVGKYTVNQNIQTDIYSATINESKSLIKLLDTEDTQEGLNAFLEKRTAVFKGR